MKTTIIKLSLALAVAGSFSLTASAKVSDAEAAKLGKELTPVGATRAGNKDGSIPEWTGKLISTQDDQGFIKDPYASDKPLFVITAQNMDKYADKLSPGMQAMLKQYPDTYKVPVYPSHRPVTYSDSIYGYAKKNAMKTELKEGGNGLLNFDATIPFPIPQNGLEAVWNHLTRYKGGAYESYTMQMVVQANGSYTPVRIHDYQAWPESLKGGVNAEKDDNVLFYFMRRALSPARLTGNVLLVHETVDQVAEPRRAWSYNAGQRRVRRAPTVAYDGPGFAAEGTRTSDNVDIFNGSPSRYNWKLVGKKEMIVPYNAYRLTSRELSYDDIIKKGHINQDAARYEMHRVWVVEATLKEDARHVYGKRVLYLDEDSWQAVLADNYDGRGQLWRVAEGHHTFVSGPQATSFATEVLYDLQSRRYIAMMLVNEEAKPYNYGIELDRKTFTPAALRRAGK
ncbi:DUF1329 domain-containing protein [Sansalvadorimonas sp. 2012CJ34-2]|uniref:DUF1329 domain-containing protein n=1 Tax=Parendozoicomonas callyspongiae TaxID=2942213 RepID=A0ABT0PJ63_9GAMM|nr:DUF1329 domain-containing protein [Sansalvadorimonas sp. 2012CJ34-2]MCL6271420.1 DUF1329 domain-containing protein [Sansalvadorimonas sp. 2012CJ34-2]